MNEKKQVFLSLETAKKMWKEECELQNVTKTSTQLFLLDNFTKEELEAKELPKTWKELNILKGGWYITNSADVECIRDTEDNSTSDLNKNVFPTKELAEASLALTQLLQLKDVYNGDWKINSNNKPNETIFFIRNTYNNPYCCWSNSGLNHVLSFQKESVRNQFAENFKDLITIALPLL